MGASRGESPLDLSQFIVREHVGLLKLTDVFDILDPATQAKVALARETPSGLVKVLRLLVNKKLLSNEVTVTEGDEKGQVLFRIEKPVFRSTLRVVDGAGRLLGIYRAKFFSLGGGFWVHDAMDRRVAEVKGDWKGWNFRFLSESGAEIGLVTKKWEGVARELFTSADTYMVSLTGSETKEPTLRILLLAAALSIDIIYKER